MGSNRHRAWKLAIATAVIAGIVVTVPTAIAAGQKEHDPNATGSVDGGTTANINVSITNTSTSGNITAMAFRVYIPSNLPVSRIGTVVKNPTTLAGTITNQATTLAASTPYIEVLNTSIQRNATYTITIPTKIPCGLRGTTYSWTTDVRQSNDFNGTNNQIPAVNPDPTPAVTTVTTGCKLVFTAQPHNAVPGATITDTNFNIPAGGPVQVAVKAADGAGATVTDFIGNVSVVTNPVTTTLLGTTSQSVVSGVASFGDLSITAANNYTLTASTTGASDGISSSFTIDYGVNTTCKAGDSQTCGTGTIPGPTTGTTGSVTVNENDTLTANLSAKFNDSNINCSGNGYVEFGDSLRVDVTNITAGTTSGLTKTLTLTKPVPAGRPHVAGTDEWRYQLCFQSQETFKAVPNFGTDQQNYDALLQALSNGVYTQDAQVVTDSSQWVLAPASPPAGYAEYRGLLPSCSLVNWVAPCLGARTAKPNTNPVQYDVTPGVTLNADATVTFVATLKVADPMTK